MCKSGTNCKFWLALIMKTLIEWARPLKKDRILSLQRDQKNTKLWKPDMSNQCLKYKPKTECFSLVYNEFKNKK